MLPKPCWTDGLELSAHHLQMGDGYHEQLIAHRVDALLDYTWGIHEIRWDTRAIGAGQIALAKLDAILPDGTPIVVDPQEGIAGLAIPLQDLGKKNALDVYVG